MNATDFDRIHSEIVNHLTAGGIVQVTTYARSTVYERKHASYFVAKPDGVYVRSGKQLNQIVGLVGPLVGIRMGRYV